MAKQITKVIKCVLNKCNTMIPNEPFNISPIVSIPTALQNKQAPVKNTIGWIRSGCVKLENDLIETSWLCFLELGCSWCGIRGWQPRDAVGCHVSSLLRSLVALDSSTLPFGGCWGHGYAVAHATPGLALGA